MTSGSSIKLNKRANCLKLSFFLNKIKKIKKEEIKYPVAEKKKNEKCHLVPPELNLESMTYLARSRGREYTKVREDVITLSCCLL